MLKFYLSYVAFSKSEAGITQQFPSVLFRSFPCRSSHLLQQRSAKTDWKICDTRTRVGFTTIGAMSIALSFLVRSDWLMRVVARLHCGARDICYLFSLCFYCQSSHTHHCLTFSSHPNCLHLDWACSRHFYIFLCLEARLPGLRRTFDFSCLCSRVSQAPFSAREFHVVPFLLDWCTFLGSACCRTSWA